MKRVLAVLSMVLMMGLATGVLAAPAGAAAKTRTIHFHDVSFTEKDVNPCSGVKGTFTATINGVIHITKLPSGQGHFTSTTTGTFTFVPKSPSEPNYTGHFTAWDGGNKNLQNLTFTATFSFHATGSDGSRISGHEVAHFSVSASGVKVSFDKANLNCG